MPVAMNAQGRCASVYVRAPVRRWVGPNAEEGGNECLR